MKSVKIYKREFYDRKYKCGGFVLTLDDLPDETVVVNGRDIELYKSRLRAEFIVSDEAAFDIVHCDENIVPYTVEYQLCDKIIKFPESYIRFEGDPRHYTAEDLFCARAIKYGQERDVTENSETQN